MATKSERTSVKFERSGPLGWDAVEPLLDDALDQPTDSRESWVRANAVNAEIANEVLALLAAAGRQGVLDMGIPASLMVPESNDEVMGRLAAALDGRYRIDSVLGEGGAATVFLAHEAKHERPVVLKVLKPEVARWIGAERFLTEIHIVARLSHPHILALIDSGDADGLLYYVMPYVGGETLRERLRRGAIAPDEALPLLRDTAAALAHAHEQRLVHRDLKPANILIVAGHAFLMDFGIAKLKPELGEMGTTIEGFAIGTPFYMAPEQAAGVPVDGRADLYSWGVVAAETLSGRTERPKDLPKSVPRALRRLINRCLEEDPAKRPRDGAELLARIDSIVERRSRVGRRSIWIAAATAAAVLAAILLYGTIRPRSLALANVTGPAVVVALTNETGDTSLAVWGRMAGDWLTQGLHQTGRAVVPWPVALQASAAIHERGSGDPIRALAAETGAQTVVTGAYYLNGRFIRFQAQVTDARNGSVLAALQAIDVPRDSMRAGIQQLRDRLMAVYAIRSDQRLASVPGLIDEPPTYEAYRAFDRGMERFNALDYPSASDAFIESWRSDTTFAIPLVYATTAFLNLSQYERADSLARAVRARQARLNPYHEMTLRYTEASLAGDGQKALEMARQAMAIAPGGRAQYNLGSLAMSVGRIDEALEALHGIDPDRGVMRGWAPYWFVLTHAQHLKGDFAGEVKAAQEARRRYPDSRAAWVHEVRALAALGYVAAADSVMAAASALPPDTYWSQGAMLATIGEELDAHGYPGSKRYYQQAIAWLANQLARTPSHRAHRYWMGSVQLDRGTPNDAAPYFESLAHDFPDDIRYRGLWGVAAAQVGDTALALRRLGPVPPWTRRDHATFVARYASIAGDRERAIDLWVEAVQAGLGGMVWLHSSARRDLARVADDPRFQRLGIIPGAGGK